MEVTNKLLAKSFEYSDSVAPISNRIGELQLLNEILEYCKSIQEKVFSGFELLDMMIEPDVRFSEVVYYIKSCKSQDVTRFLLELLKKIKLVDDLSERQQNEIWCSCGKYADTADDLNTYACKRQEYLESINNPYEYGEFMESCFPHSKFAIGCKKELRYIQKFDRCVVEITRCLSVLDRYALALYNKYHNDLSSATRELQAKLKDTVCALQDPEHRKDLLFEFELEETKDRDAAVKKVECQPHFKLVRPDSDLRVYFYWRDSAIADGKKVLIGQVGRHAW